MASTTKGGESSSTTPTIVPIPLPKGYQRLGKFPIDPTSVFTTGQAFGEYLSSATCYPGQVLALLNEDANTCDLYKVLPKGGVENIGSITISYEIGTKITVIGNHGAYKDGDVITSNTDMREIISKVLQTRILPVYTNPDLTINEKTPTLNIVEVGTKVTPTFTPVFIQGDAGAFSSISYSGRVQGVHFSGPDKSDLTTCTYAERTIEDITNQQSLACTIFLSFAAGAVKNDNLGTPDTEHAIKAGNIEKTWVWKGYRKVFFGVNKTAIRELGDSLLNPKAGTTFSIHVPKGSTFVAFAYPATLSDVSSVKYVELGNSEVKDTFSTKTEKVAGANDYNPIDYKVYYYEPAVALGSDATNKITI